MNDLNLKEKFSYDPETGLLRWLSGAKKGHVAGSKNNHGYVIVQIGPRGQTKNLAAHRIVMHLVHGISDWTGIEVDHINGVKSDNRIQNLRIATRSQNCGNMSGQKSSASGMKGVGYMPQQQKWRATITLYGKFRHLGSFDTAEDANEFYELAASLVFGRFAHRQIGTDIGLGRPLMPKFTQAAFSK